MHTLALFLVQVVSTHSLSYFWNPSMQRRQVDVRTLPCSNPNLFAQNKRMWNDPLGCATVEVMISDIQRAHGILTPMVRLCKPTDTQTAIRILPELSYRRYEEEQRTFNSRTDIERYGCFYDGQYNVPYNYKQGYMGFFDDFKRDVATKLSDPASLRDFLNRIRPPDDEGFCKTIYDVSDYVEKIARNLTRLGRHELRGPEYKDNHG